MLHWLVGSTIADGTAVWSVREHSAIVLKGRAIVQHVSVRYFTNAAVLIQTPYGTQDAPLEYPANANSFQLRDMSILYCGQGIAVAGGDANAGTGINLMMQEIGLSPDKGPFPPNAGGHGIDDRGFLGNTWIGCLVEICSGRTYLTKHGGVGPSQFMGCYGELDEPANLALIHFPSMMVGGAAGVDLASDGVILQPGAMRNIAMVDPAMSTKAGFNYLGQPCVNWMTHNDELESFIGHVYGAELPGEWAFGHLSFRYATSIMGRNAADGMGNWRDIHGHFFGANESDHFFIGPKGMLTSKFVHGGLFRAGDKIMFQGGLNGASAVGDYEGLIVKTQGYRGPHWRPGNYVAGSSGNPADLVEPSTNDPIQPASGAQVWKCTTGGDSGATEPAWPASPTPSVTQVPDGAVVWTYAGTVAEYNRIGLIA